MADFTSLINNSNKAHNVNQLSSTMSSYYSSRKHENSLDTFHHHYPIMKSSPPQPQQLLPFTLSSPLISSSSSSLILSSSDDIENTRPLVHENENENLLQLQTPTKTLSSYGTTSHMSLMMSPLTLHHQHDTVNESHVNDHTTSDGLCTTPSKSFRHTTLLQYTPFITQSPFTLTTSTGAGAAASTSTTSAALSSSPTLLYRDHENESDKSTLLHIGHMKPIHSAIDTVDLSSFVSPSKMSPIIHTVTHTSHTRPAPPDDQQQHDLVPAAVSSTPSISTSFKRTDSTSRRSIFPHLENLTTLNHDIRVKEENLDHNQQTKENDVNHCNQQHIQKSVTKQPTCSSSINHNGSGSGKKHHHHDDHNDLLRRSTSQSHREIVLFKGYTTYHQLTNTHHHGVISMNSPKNAVSIGNGNVNGSGGNKIHSKNYKAEKSGKQRGDISIPSPRVKQELQSSQLSSSSPSFTSTYLTPLHGDTVPSSTPLVTPRGSDRGAASSSFQSSNTKASSKGGKGSGIIISTSSKPSSIHVIPPPSSLGNNLNKSSSKPMSNTIHLSSASKFTANISVLPVTPIKHGESNTADASSNHQQTSAAMTPTSRTHTHTATPPSTAAQPVSASTPTRSTARRPTHMLYIDGTSVHSNPTLYTPSKRASANKKRKTPPSSSSSSKRRKAISLTMPLSLSTSRVKKQRSNVRKADTIGCSCTRSRCQKRYCDCYNNGRACIAACKCVDCKNGSCEEKHEVEADGASIEKQMNDGSNQKDSWASTNSNTSVDVNVKAEDEKSVGVARRSLDADIDADSQSGNGSAGKVVRRISSRRASK